MNYQDTLDFLYDFARNHKYSRQKRYTPELVSLDRSRLLMAKLGDPQVAYPVIHITGTKGKGSVGAMCAAVLQAAGYRTGLFSSPHLQDFRERFQINGTMISKADLVRVVEDIRPSIAQIENLTWFEVITAMAFEYFRQKQVDVAVIEVGMGGRLDATNIVNPLVSVITSLSYDHVAVLGDTLEEIAREKAGIIKPGVPVVSAPQPEPAREVIEATTAHNNAELVLVGRDWAFETMPGNLHIETFYAAAANEPPVEYRTILLGPHQAINATVTLATMQQLHPHGFNVSDQAIRRGLMQVNWSGRLEIINDNPLTIIDAAHNADSAYWLAKTINERMAQRPHVLVFGAKADKDIKGMLAELLPVTDRLIVTQAVDARAESPEQIALVARSLGFIGKIDVIHAVPDALAAAEMSAGPNGLVMITGSLYLIGEVRTICKLEPGKAINLKRIRNNAGL